MGNFKKTLLIVIAAGAMALAGLFYIVPAFRGDIEVRGEWFIGPVRLSVYGLLFALAIVLGYALVRRVLPRVGLARSVADDAILWLVVGGLMGARIYHVFFSLDYYRAHWLEAIEIYRGGLSIYGAMAGGIVAMILFARWKKIDLLRSLDVVALVLPLAQSLGRWGNFFNREAFGLPTDLPWKLYIPPASRPTVFLQESFFHPTFLYESLWDLAVFYVVWRVLRGSYSTTPDRPGFTAGTYLVLYAAGRFLIESLRIDSYYVAGLKVDQISSLLAIVLGSLLMWRSYARTNLATR